MDSPALALWAGTRVAAGLAHCDPGRVGPSRLRTGSARARGWARPACPAAAYAEDSSRRRMARNDTMSCMSEADEASNSAFAR